MGGQSAARGFTLIELVAAFAIFAIGVTILLSIGANALGMAKRSSEYTRAALHAQSKLDELGVGEALEEGSDAGEFDDGYRWELAVTEQEPPAADTGAVETIPIELYKVELVVRWDDDRREAKFSTLRASNPSVGGL
ncbi:MAG TPA: prepilin-type N-terminal cleavage/methylation domain-containing protein [Candidatus Saccharimonadia bacterium]|nr:prepilin-type N-terminal cleavage/methylation domain-containing protein [Candidatus Saccharimonadia bacterium]